ncbi:MAG: hypothetical protein P8Z80_07810 [Pseudolabrys sp.]
MQKQRCRKSAVFRSSDTARAVIGDGATLDDPQDAIEQELLGIWLSISRVRELIRARPVHLSAPNTTPNKTTPKKTVPSRKQPRRKAA